MDNRASGLRSSVVATVPFLVGVALWELGVRVGEVSKLALPAPSAVLATLVSTFGQASFWVNWIYTLGLWASAFVVGVSIGLVFGFSVGVSKSMARLFLPIFGFLRAVPPISVFPIALVALGAGGLPIGVVAAAGAALNVFPGTATAARESSERFDELARVMSVTRTSFLLTFVAPGAALHTLAAGRVAATYAFAVTIAGEMLIGGAKGVGGAILDLTSRYELESAYAYVICAGLVGVTIDLALVRFADVRGRLD